MNIKVLAQKRIAGVPVIYIAAAAAVILAIVAWRMKSIDSTTTEEDTGEPAGDSAPIGDVSGSGDAGVEAGDVYPQLPTGTVTTPPVTTPIDGTGGTNASIETNEEWLKAAAFWLANEKGISAGTAQAALQKYLDGSSLSYTEGQYRDAAVKQFGFPPDLTPTPVTGAKPAPAKIARVQGPLPRAHYIETTGDDSYGELARLYYPTHGGATEANIDLIQAANPQLPQSGPFKIGTRVNIPAYRAPKYFTATKTANTLAQIAAKNGVSQEAVRRLNDGATRVTFPARVGTRVRVA